MEPCPKCAERKIEELERRVRDLEQQVRAVPMPIPWPGAPYYVPYPQPQWTYPQWITNIPSTTFTISSNATIGGEIADFTVTSASQE